MIRVDSSGIRLDSVPKKLVSLIKSILNTNSKRLQSHIRQERMTGGTTDTRLRVRTGRLRASVKSLPVTAIGNKIDGGVSIGTVYARVHIGPRNRETIIRPKTRKYLTIPLPGAVTKAGVIRGSARSEVFGETFIARSKKGNLIIFGKRRYMKGPRLGQTRSEILPLFLLSKEVRIKSRIDPMELIQWIRPKLIEDFKNIGI